jgi:hypothetical protein
MSFKDKMEVGLKPDAPYRPDNLPEIQQGDPDCQEAGEPGDSPRLRDAREACDIPEKPRVRRRRASAAAPSPERRPRRKI